MRGAKRAAPILAAVGCAFALGAAPAAALPVPKSSEQADRFLDRAMEKFVNRDNGPVGAISVVQRDGEVSVHRAGVADVSTGEPPRKRMHLRIASTAKAFSGFVALDAVNDGALSLDTTAGEVRPDLPPAWHDAKLGDILHHTAGIPDFGTPAFGAAVGAAPFDPPPPRDLLDFAPTGLDPSAGTFKYSNSDNIIVGLMVQTALGSAYEKEIQNRVAIPLGLGRTFLHSADSVPEPNMRGYDADGEDVTDEVDFGGWAWASGGIVSSPANLNKFIRGYIGNVARLDDSGFIQGAHSEPRGPGKNAAGMAVFRYEMPCGTVYGHTGNILGYTHFMAATADGSRSVTFSFNKQYPPDLLPAMRKLEERAVCAALA
jgi:D-alanyl-D-alanine carboxypeptidase